MKPEMLLDQCLQVAKWSIKYQLLNKIIKQ